MIAMQFYASYPSLSLLLWRLHSLQCNLQIQRLDASHLSKVDRTMTSIQTDSNEPQFGKLWHNVIICHCAFNSWSGARKRSELIYYTAINVQCSLTLHTVTCSGFVLPEACTVIVTIAFSASQSGLGAQQRVEARIQRILDQRSRSQLHPRW